jgi:hypothetical protein
MFKTVLIHLLDAVAQAVQGTVARRPIACTVLTPSREGPLRYRRWIARYFIGRGRFRGIRIPAQSRSLSPPDNSNTTIARRIQQERLMVLPTTASLQKGLGRRVRLT